jgi:hypothetical protein
MEVIMNRKLLYTLIFVMLSLLAFTQSVSADIAPPLQPSGAGPSMAEYQETMVEMGWESVTIYIEEASELYYAEQTMDCVDAYVTASFLMANHNSEPETLDVVFPLNDPSGLGDGRFAYPEIQDLVIYVDNQQVQWETVTTPNPLGEDKEPVKWAQFTVTFPLEQVIFIDVNYYVQSTGYFPEAAFSYILETGAGWYGPIQTAQIVLEFPYEASPENILTDGSTTLGKDDDVQSTWPVFEGNTATWKYANFEPEPGENWEVTIIAPHIWEEVLELREDIAAGEPGAYAKITKWYDAIIMDRVVRTGTEDLVPLAIQAYEKAIEEDPQDDEPLAGYANFLLFLYDFDREAPEYQEKMDLAYQLATQAQEINLMNDTALWVLDQLEVSHGYVPPESPEAEQVVVEETQVISAGGAGGSPSQTSETADEKSPDNLTYILGGGLAVALVVVIMLVYQLGKKSAKN